MPPPSGAAAPATTTLNRSPNLPSRHEPVAPRWPRAPRRRLQQGDDVNATVARSQRAWFSPGILGTIRVGRNRSSTTTQTRRRTTREGAAVVGTEVQGFRPEHDSTTKRREQQTEEGGAAAVPRACLHAPGTHRGTTHHGSHRRQVLEPQPQHHRRSCILGAAAPTSSHPGARASRGRDELPASCALHAWARPGPDPTRPGRTVGAATSDRAPAQRPPRHHKGRAAGAATMPSPPPPAHPAAASPLRTAAAPA
jgi:hypothetical protein